MSKNIIKRVKPATLGKMILKTVATEPLGDDDIRKHLGSKVPIIKYSEFADYNDINELLPNDGNALVYLIEDSPNNGHWCCVKRHNNEILCYDPYGNKVDNDLKWTDMKTREQLGQGEPHLSNLLKKTDKAVKYNNINYQEHKPTISTCGRHCVLFILSNLGLEDYYKFMKSQKKKGVTYDDIVTFYIH
jgi:hypothetical protein